MHKPAITTIVVNWNLKQTTTSCLESLAGSDYPCQVILVDNGSSDGSGHYLKERFPGLEVIALPENLGFGRACNIALQRVLARDEPLRPDFILLLNNDTTIHPRLLSELVAIAQAHPQAGILGPKVFFAGSRRIWYGGARRRKGVLAAAGTGCGEQDAARFDLLRPVDYVFGAAMFVRRQVFETAGLFDERYFMYLEDLDLCLRAQAAGFSLLYVPQAQVWHIASASTSQSPALRRYYQAKSTLLFLRKHQASLSLLPALLFWSAVAFKIALLDLLHGDLESLAACGATLFGDLRQASWPTMASVLSIFRGTHTLSFREEAIQVNVIARSDLCDEAISPAKFITPASDTPPD